MPKLGFFLVLMSQVIPTHADLFGWTSFMGSFGPALISESTGKLEYGMRSEFRPSLASCDVTLSLDGKFYAPTDSFSLITFNATSGEKMNQVELVGKERYNIANPRYDRGTGKVIALGLPWRDPGFYSFTQDNIKYLGDSNATADVLSISPETGTFDVIGRISIEKGLAVCESALAYIPALKNTLVSHNQKRNDVPYSMYYNIITDGDRSKIVTQDLVNNLTYIVPFSGSNVHAIAELPETGNLAVLSYDSSGKAFRLDTVDPISGEKAPIGNLSSNFTQATQGKMMAQGLTHLINLILEDKLGQRIVTIDSETGRQVWNAPIDGVTVESLALTTAQ